MENVGVTTPLTQSRWETGNTQGNREKEEIQGNIQDNKAEESLHNICRRDWWTWGSLVRNEKPEDKERLPDINKQKRRENARNKKKE